MIKSYCLTIKRRYGVGNHRLSGCLINSSSAGYTHVIAFGGNDVTNLLGAFTRYYIGNALKISGALNDSYEDPVSFENVFGIIGSEPRFTSDPLLKVS